MITLTISDEQVQRMKSEMDLYLDEPVSVSEYAIMVWLQEAVAQLVEEPAFYSEGRGSYPRFEVNAPIRDNNKELSPVGRIDV